MKIRKGVFLCNLLIFLMIMLTLVLLYFANSTYDKVREANQKNEILQGLAEELRASSQSLTDYVRLYATTSEETFKEIYQSIVDVRAGTKNRPRDASVAPSQKIPLLDLLELHGVTPAEYALVEEANGLSNTLITLEVEAMNAVEGKFKDKNGAYTINAEPDTRKAINLVFGSLYQDEVAKIMAPLDEFVTHVNSRTNTIILDLEASLRSHSVMVATSMSIALLVTLLSYLIVRNRVVKPLCDTTQFAEKIASGDLDVQIPILRWDEIGVLRQTLNLFVSNLREKLDEVEQKTLEANQTAKEATTATEKANSALEEVQKNVEHTLNISKQLENTMQTLTEISTKLGENISISAQGAERQSQSITETVTAIDQMNSTVLEVAQSASFAADISNQTKEKANKGEGVVRTLIDAIDAVYENSNSMKSDISTLSQHAQNVSSIMNVISDIADQTNLLALNAAIEAARAGDAGRGFAVVADEVRKLAEKTMSSTTDVATAINAIQSSVENSIKQVEVTVQGVELATKLAGECGISLKDIVSMADSSAEQVGAIATASEAQSLTSGEITKTIMNINDIASKTTSMMNEAAQVTVMLTGQNKVLQELIFDLQNAQDK